MSVMDACCQHIKSLHNQGHFEAAARYAAAALRERPNDARLWELLGIACHAMRDFAAATRALETATMLAPHRIRNRVALALLHHQCGNLVAAYRLVTAVDGAQLIAACCPARLLGLVALFNVMGDTARRDACRSRLAEISNGRIDWQGSVLLSRLPQQGARS